jgi:replication-associated recombination protein RarA
VSTSSLLGQSSSLCEKYRPLKIADFVGLAEPKRILQKLVARPYSVALLFEGKSGSGKTAMALAFAAEILAQVHFLPAHECSRDHVAKLWMNCHAEPSVGLRMHLVLVDQADTLSRKQQIDLRSKIDGPESLDHVIWVFTVTPTTKLVACRRENVSRARTPD